MEKIAIYGVLCGSGSFKIKQHAKIYNNFNQKLQYTYHIYHKYITVGTDNTLFS